MNYQSAKTASGYWSNKFKYFISLWFIVIAVGIDKPLQGCTSFCIKEGKHLLLAKNLDWPINDGLILINKRGLKKTAYIQDSNKLVWTSRYGSITFNQFGKEFPLGGMNEKGLVIEELNSWGKIPDDDQAYRVNEFQWVQYCLDNFSTIGEIIALGDSILPKIMLVHLHYIITDRNGNSLVVEHHGDKSRFIYGEDLPYPILSNNHYQQSLNYIKNYKGFGGDLKVRSNSSGERFVKVASLLKAIEPHPQMKETAFSVLDSVSQDDTQWSIVYDIGHKTIHFRTAGDQKMKSIRLDRFDFSCKTPVLYADVNAKATSCGRAMTISCYAGVVN